jgi:hypothetical protein
MKTENKKLVQKLTNFPKIILKKNKRKFYIMLLIHYSPLPLFHHLKARFVHDCLQE